MMVSGLYRYVTGACFMTVRTRQLNLQHCYYSVWLYGCIWVHLVWEHDVSILFSPSQN